MKEIEHKFTKDKIYSLILDSKASENENFWEDYYSSFVPKLNAVCDFLSNFKEYTNEIIESGIFPLMTASKEDNVKFLTKVYIENSNLLYHSDPFSYRATELFFKDSKLLKEYYEMKNKDISIKDFTDFGVNSTFPEGY